MFMMFHAPRKHRLPLIGLFLVALVTGWALLSAG